MLFLISDFVFNAQGSKVVGSSKSKGIILSNFIMLLSPSALSKIRQQQGGNKPARTQQLVLGGSPFFRRKNFLFWVIAEPSIWLICRVCSTKNHHHRSASTKRVTVGDFEKSWSGNSRHFSSPKQNASCCSDNIQIFPGICWEPLKNFVKMKFQQALLIFVPLSCCKCLS